MGENELPLVTKLISANRITISKEIVESLDLKKGDIVQVFISKLESKEVEVSAQ